MKKFFVRLLAFVELVTCVGCSVPENTNHEISTSTSTSKNEEVLIYEDDSLVAVFKGVSDVTGQIGMIFTFENKSNNEITVLPINSSVNDVMVQFVSGIPAAIQPGKTFNQVWMANPDVVGISDSSEVTKIEVVLAFADTETEMITIKP